MAEWKPRAGFGGPEVGRLGGRPKGLGKRLKLIQEMSNQELQAGSLPVVVMLRNMRYYDETAQDLRGKLDEHIARLDGKKLKDKEAAKEVAEAARTLRDLHEFRMQAQSCALDVASFVHPRLGQLQITEGDESPRRVSLEHMSIEQKRALFRDEMRSIKAGEVTNLVIDHVPKEDE